MFWNIAKNECVEKCDETHDIRRVCQLCKNIDSRTPAAYNGDCVPCYVANISLPKYDVEKQ